MRLEYYVVAKDNKILYTDECGDSYWQDYFSLRTLITKFESFGKPQEIVDGTQAVYFRWPDLENIDGATVKKMVVDIEFKDV